MPDRMAGNAVTHQDNAINLLMRVRSSAPVVDNQPDYLFEGGSNKFNRVRIGQQHAMR
jgi:hypothetical protein